MIRPIAIVLCVTLYCGCGSDETDPVEDPKDTVVSTDTSAPETIAIPCVFDPPIGATCNPYPACASDGCSGDQVCTVVFKEDGITRVECHSAGAVPLGGVCDHQKGPFCEKGACVDGECRGFCVGPEDCGGSATCTTMEGVPGNVTVCGQTMEDCNPLAPIESCTLGTACYWQNQGTDCLKVKQAGQQSNACSCPNCCSPGFACVIHEEQELCGAVCSVEGEVMPCSELCGGLSIKTLSDGLGACVPQAEGTEPPPETPTCDALLQDCSGAAQGCYPTDKGDRCLTKGNKPVGESCTNVNDCVPGSTCFASKCYGLCDPDDGSNAMCETGFNAACTPLSNSSAGFCDE